MTSKEIADGFKESMRRAYGVEYTDEEAEEALNNLAQFFKTLVEIDSKQHHRRTSSL